jgi:hypothetical protein
MNNRKFLYKAYQIEEFLDIVFFHPLGYMVAKTAFRLKLTPNQITYVSMFFGIAGGLMLAKKDIVYLGFSLLIVSSIFDSADGQLARMTNKGTLAGRILDGLIGYFMFTSAYAGLTILYLSTPGSLGLKFMVPLALIGGINSALQSSLYDFYRTCFSQAAVKRKVPSFKTETKLNPLLKFAHNSYSAYQKILANSHINLIDKLQKRFPDGTIDEQTAEKYKTLNLKMVRNGWNILGDNTRFLLILIAIILCKPHWYFMFILGPLNLITVFLILKQKPVDKKFTAFIEGKSK